MYTYNIQFTTHTVARSLTHPIQSRTINLIKMFPIVPISICGLQFHCVRSFVWPKSVHLRVPWWYVVTLCKQDKTQWCYWPNKQCRVNKLIKTQINQMITLVFSFCFWQIDKIKLCSYVRERTHSIIIYIEISKANITHANYTPFIRSAYVFVHWISRLQWILREWGPIIMTCFPLQRIWLLNFAGTSERGRERLCVYLTHSFWFLDDSIQKPETIHAYAMHTDTHTHTDGEKIRD